MTTENLGQQPAEVPALTPASAEGDFDLEAAGGEIASDLFGAEASSEVPETELPELEVEAKPAEPPSPATPAPKTWRPEAAAKFGELPAEVQQEILKREEDMFRGLEGYKAEATLGKALRDIVSPYAELFQSQGINPLDQVSGMLRAHVALATGSPEQKQQFFQQLADAYGVNIEGGAPYVDPQVASLQKQLEALQSRLNGREEFESAQLRTQLQTEIDTFASNPAHPYFDEVATDIAGLLRSGAAKDLAEAYEKAVWANPLTRAKEQARLTAEAGAKAKAEADAKLKQIRQATGANVRSSSKAVSGTAPLGSMDDTLSEALANIKSRV